MGRVQGRGHRAARDPECLGDPRVIKVGVVAEEERQPLALRERGGAAAAAPVSRCPLVAGSSAISKGEAACRRSTLERFRASLMTIRQTTGHALAVAQPAR